MPVYHSYKTLTILLIDIFIKPGKHQ